jgi:hypothetical protein
MTHCMFSGIATRDVHRSANVLLLLAIAFGLAACEGGSVPPVRDASTTTDAGLGEDPDGGTREEIAREDLPRREATARCARLYGCCTQRELTDVFASEADCIGGVLTGIELLASALASAIEAGTLVYRPDLAAACVEQIEALTCEQVQDQRVALSDILGARCLPYEGLLANDAACENGIGCASWYCVQERLAGAGHCGDPPGLGDPCVSACGAHLRCVGTTATTLGACEPYSGQGEACATTADCQNGLDCVLPARLCELRPFNTVCDGL